MLVKFKKFISAQKTTQKIFLLSYLILIVLATPGQLSWWTKLAFWLFCLFLFWIAGIEKKLKIKNEKLKISNWWLLIPLGVLIITRIVPFLRWGEAPLGYDTGIYFKSFENCFARIAEGGCLGSPVTFISNLLYLFGWETSHLLSVFYIILSLFVGLGIYVVAKEYFSKQVAFFSFLIFSLSSSQFLTYWWFYWGIMVALILVLIAFYLLKKRSWLVVPVAGFMGAVYPLSFLPFGLSMVLYFIFESLPKTSFFRRRIPVFGKERRSASLYGQKETEKWSARLARFLLSRLTGFTFLSGVGIFFVALTISWQTFLGYLSYYTERYGQIKGYPEYLAQELTGQFVNFDLYRGLILIYLPFAVLGLVKLFQKRKFNYLFFYFVANFVIIYFNLIFHNRYIILLDSVAIVLAGAILFEFVNRFSLTRLGKTAIVLLLLGGLFNVFYQSWQAQPWISREELREIKSLAEVTEDDAFVMVVSSYYSPWVYGYSQRKTIAPGLFEYNKWDLLKWRTFWSTSNLELRHQLLDDYAKPLYIYIGDKIGQMDFSDDPGFVKISKRIWQYKGDLLKVN